MKILFRVDSSVQMGSGHLMRCLTLANELSRRGVKVTFVTRLHPGHLIQKLEASNHLLYKLPAPMFSGKTLIGYEAWLGVSIQQDIDETLGMIDGQYYDWVVVDHYGLDKRWESIIRSHVNKIMVIDDLADRMHDCDLLLDQNYFGLKTESRYINRVSASSRLLLGPGFALLQPEYFELQAASAPSTGIVKRVLVFFGNSDKANQTSKVLAAFTHSELEHIVIDVVAGSNHPDFLALKRQAKTRKNTVFHDELPTLSELMMQSDLVIGAGGATTWERMCLGRPSVVVCIADNQREVSQALFVDGYQVLFTGDEVDTPEAWYQEISRLIDLPLKLRVMAEKSSQLVDGLGLKRVTKELIGAEQCTE